MRKTLKYSTLILLALFCISLDLHGQVIQGKVIDAESEIPLAYVNIGVINIAKGAVSIYTLQIHLKQ